MDHVEVNQKADFAACEFQVRQDLRKVDGQELLDGLQFDND